MKSNKNTNLMFNVLKGYACIFVVFMHIEFPGVVGTYIQCVSRWAVPFFFSVAGFYSFYEYETKQNPIPRKIKRVLLLMAEAFIFYIILRLIRDGFGTTLNNITPKTVFGLIFLNLPINSDSSLWYLLALIYVYIIFWYAKKFDKICCLKKITPLCLLGLFLLGQGLWIAGIKVPNSLYRNFLFEGLPFFMIGYMIHEKSININLDGKIEILILFIIGTILCLIERIAIGRDFGVHLGSVIQTISLIMLAVKLPHFNSMKCIRKIGEKYSEYIYVFHRFIYLSIWEYGLEKLSDTNIYEMVKPICVLALTLAFSAFYVFTKSGAKRMIHKK